MSDNITALDTRHVATVMPDESGIFSDARIALIRNQIAKDAPEGVFAAMIDIAKRRNLDPLAKQIIVVSFKGVWQMIVTIDGYRSIAEQTGRYAGNDAPVFTYGPEAMHTSEKKLIPESATVTVYKLLEGDRHPFSATVFWEEFDGKRNNWLSMPRTMLAKVAESHALRKAFPAVLSGTYTPEEMDQAYIEVSGQAVNQQTGEITNQSRSSAPIPGMSQASRSRPQPSHPDATSGQTTVGQGGGKARHFRGKLADLMERINWTDADLEAVAVYDHKRPIDELSGDELESTFRDLDDLARNDPDALKTLQRTIHESRQALATASEAINHDTGEILEDSSNAGRISDIADSHNERKRADDELLAWASERGIRRADLHYAAQALFAARNVTGPEELSATDLRNMHAKLQEKDAANHNKLLQWLDRINPDGPPTRGEIAEPGTDDASTVEGRLPGVDQNAGMDRNIDAVAEHFRS